MTTQSLNNFNGVHGATVFTDDVAGVTWSTRVGSPSLTNVNVLFGSTSLTLDGSSAVQLSPVVSFPGDFTIEAYFRFDSTPSQARTLFNLLGTDYYLLMSSAQNVLNFTSVSLGIRQAISSVPFISGDWNHVAMCRINGEIRILVNDEIVSELYPFTETVTGIELGFAADGVSDAFVGEIDSFRMIDESIYNTQKVIPNVELGLAYTIIDTSVNIDVETFNLDLQHIKPFDGGLLDNLNFYCGAGVAPVDPPVTPTTTNIISGVVTKLGAPFELRVVAVSVELIPTVLGSTISDPSTGAYSIDVWPWVDEVLVYAVPDYGSEFSPSVFVSAGGIIHPTVPNKNVYIAQNAGTLGATEPDWPEAGSINSGAVTLLAAPLHRPLMNGFLKPTVTPI